MYKEHLIQFVEYHILKDSIVSSRFSNDTSYSTIQGDSIITTVSGATIKLNGAATITKADAVASNGIVHGIDAVLTPKFLTTDLVETLRSKKQFSTLVTIIDGIPGLAATLNSGNNTFFAPDDTAFERLNRTTPLATLLANTTVLTDIILYHVVPNVLIEKFKLREGFFETLQGQKIELDITKRRPIINEVAEVGSYNLLASTAIIHTIDRVLIPPPPLVDVVATAAARSDLTTFTQAVTAASVETVLQGPGNFTCFLPTNEAFGKLATLQELLANATALAPILLYHCVSGQILGDDLKDGRLTTLQGETIDVDRHGNHGRVHINDDADIVAYDIRASNGIIHLIDQVLEIPDPLPTIAGYLAANKEFSTLSAALQSTGLDTLLQSAGNFTLFAPDNRAFERHIGADKLAAFLNETAFLTDLLRYHVLTEELFQSGMTDTIVKASDGANLRIDVNDERKRARLNGDVKVVEFDIECSNGVIHVLRDVLSVPTDLYSTLQANGLSLLAKAIDAAGLRATLESGDFTLFAPDDRAFKAVPGLDALMADPAALKPILEYHLVPGLNLLSGDLREGTYTTVQGSSIAIDFTKKKRYWVQVNGSWILDFNLLSANGVIHVINEVLAPSGSSSSI